MSVVAFLPDRLLTHVRDVFDAEPDFVVAKSWDDVDAIVRQTPVTAVILDPDADGSMNVEAVELLLNRFPSLSIVAYVSLSQQSFCAMARLARAGLQNVLLQRFEDSPREFREMVERARKNPLKKKFVEELQPQLKLLPLKLLSIVDDMLDSPHCYHTVQDIALRAEISALKLYRAFSVARLGSPRRFLNAVKVLNAVGYLQDRGYSVADVARKVGYRNSRILADHTLDVFGLTPSIVRSHVAPEDAVARLITWLRNQPTKDMDQRRRFKYVSKENVIRRSHRSLI